MDDATGSTGSWNLNEYDLGPFSWPVTTRNPEAQAWFDQGIVWCQGFHHEQAIACFERTLAEDPECAMAHWGIAYAVGPNYNKTWAMFDPNEKARSLARASAALASAVHLGSDTSPVEQALIDALRARYPQTTPIEDQSPWNDAYAEAMRAVHRRFPNDLNVLALFVEAVMNRTPWQMWDLKTAMAAAGAGTIEVRALCEAAFQDDPNASAHPGLLHLYVHLMEMSPFPELAIPASERLRDLVPDSGHLVHMATHIDLLCGNYQNVVRWNEKAVAADEKYLARAGANNFYTFYRVHNYHFAAYGAMFLGCSRIALRAAQGLIDTIPEPLLRVQSPPMADYLEGYLSMKQHVLIRFGRWHEIVAQPLPDDGDLYCVTKAMMLYAKGVAYAAMGDVVAAAATREAFHSARERVPGTRRVHNNLCTDLLAIATEMLDGELEYRRGNFDAAFNHLRRSVDLDDNLPFDEPWAWMQPTRHALGALLLEQGRAEEAEAVYRADLGLDGRVSRACHHPDNLWSLHGLHECLRRRGATTEAMMVKQRLTLASALADVPVTTSCFCRRASA